MEQKKEELLTAKEREEIEMVPSDCRILIYSGMGCNAIVSKKIYQKLVNLTKESQGITLKYGLEDAEEFIDPKAMDYQTLNEQGPLMWIQKGEKIVQYTKVQIEDCEEIVQKSVLADEVIARLLEHKDGHTKRNHEGISDVAKQTMLALKNCEKLDAESFKNYIASEEFQNLMKAMYERHRDLIDEAEPSDATSKQICMVEVARYFMKFLMLESCGICSPCRIGTKRMLEILEKIVDGDGEPEDLDRLEHLAYIVKDCSHCGLGKNAPLLVTSIMKNYHEEFVEHIEKKQCAVTITIEKEGE